MSYLVHTAHLQFLGFWVGAIGWTLLAVTMGLVQWRVWYVANVDTITSGVAWVGLWRVCFLSHNLNLTTSKFNMFFCQGIRTCNESTPVEISMAQVLVPVALLVGMGGNASAVYALRRVYFGLDQHKPLKVAFSVTGSLYILAGACSLVPLAWNMGSVVANCTICFPSEFQLPPAPMRQEVGTGIGMGITASLMVIVSGFIFLSYRIPHTLPEHSRSHTFRFSTNNGHTLQNSTILSESHASPGNGHIKSSPQTFDNQAFESYERI